MDDCVFCKIIKGEIPSEKVYEDEDVIAFKDINPVTPIHILVIPKKHIATLLDVTEEDSHLISKLFVAINKIAKQIGIEESGWLLTSVENNEEVPKASDIKDVKLENENGFVTLLLLDLGAYSQKYGSRKSVKKNLTIPFWLNKRAEKLNINFSKTLQDALMEKVLKNK